MSYHRIGEGGTKYWGKKAAGILFTDGNNILLLKRSDKTDNNDTWGLPGGKSKGEETPIDTAIRETKEETGLKDIPGNRFDSIPTKDGHHHFVTFLYKITEPFDVKLSSEHSDWEWFDLSNLKSVDLHPKLKENFPRYLRVIQRKFGKTFTEWAKIQDLMIYFG